MHPYFVATIGRETYKSKDKIDGQIPKWDETFTFKLDRNNSTLKIDINHLQQIV